MGKGGFFMTDFIIENDILREYNGDEKNIIIPDGVKEIGNNVFGYNRNLTGVTVPSSVEKIGEGAFFGCSNLA